MLDSGTLGTNVMSGNPMLVKYSMDENLNPIYQRQLHISKATLALQACPFIPGNGAIENGFDFSKHHTQLGNRILIIRRDRQAMVS